MREFLGELRELFYESKNKRQCFFLNQNRLFFIFDLKYLILKYQSKTKTSKVQSINTKNTK